MAIASHVVLQIDNTGSMCSVPLPLRFDGSRVNRVAAVACNVQMLTLTLLVLSATRLHAVAVLQCASGHAPCTTCTRSGDASMCVGVRHSQRPRCRHELGCMLSAGPCWRLQLRGGGGDDQWNDPSLDMSATAMPNVDGEEKAGPGARERSSMRLPSHEGESGDNGLDESDAGHAPEACSADSEEVEDLEEIGENFLTPSLLHDLEAPLRRKILRNPKGHYVYNRTADRWEEQRKWDPLALPGEDRFHRMFGQRQHPLRRTARRKNETHEEFVRRCPCWPPYCRKCPLREKPLLSASAMLLHERITGNKLNVSTALRCGEVPPFSPERAQGLSGYCMPRTLDDHVDALLQVTTPTSNPKTLHPTPQPNP